MAAPPRALVSRVAIAIALACVGFLATRLASRSWSSVVTYTPPYRFADGEARGGTPLSHRAVLVLVDGLRLDASREMPFLNQLRSQGADFACSAAAPSYSRPGRAALGTGAWSAIHGATTNFHSKALGVDNLFRAARRAGRSCAVAGSLWKSLFSPDFGPTVDREPPVSDQPGRYAELEPVLRRYGHESAAFVAADSSDLALLDLLVTDYAAHEFGGRSDEYRRAVERSDRMLEALVKGLDLTRTTVLVTSDHGHLDEGGHGGPEPEVLATPLVIVGEGVRHGVRSVAQQIDVAPTIAALLGLGLPGASQGRILLEALDVGELARVDLLAQLWRQKAAFGRDYLRALGIVSPPVGAAPARDAVALAQAITAQESGLEAQREARIASDRRSRLPVLLVVGLLPLPVLAWLGRRASRAAVVAGAAAVVLYALVFRFVIYGRGIRLALSAINHEEDVEPYFLRIGAVALLAVVAALGMAFALRCRTSAAPPLGALVDLGLGTIGALLYLLAVVVAAGHWRHGLFMEWHRADMGEGFGSFVSLVQMQSLGYSALLVPALAWLALRLRPRPR